MRKNVLIASILLILAVGTLATTTPIAAQPKDIVDTAIDAGSFKTLVFALEATGLNATLKGSGPFTVFAPTDKAFTALPVEVLNWLVANPTALTEVLLYHVVSGKLMAADVVALSSIETVQGGNLTVDTTTPSPLDVKIDGANITATDIECSNGVIHVIDAVLIPEGVLDIVRTAIYAGSFTTLVTALGAADLVSALESEGPFTVFAPTDDAFAALEAANPGILAYLLEHPTELAEILKYHVVPDYLLAADVLELGCLTTLEGGFLNIDTTDGVVKINGATIVLTDIECSNGVIHVIDAVLIPMCIHPVEARGLGLVRLGWWRWTIGLATLEIYPFNSAEHPSVTPHDRPVCVWVVKLTIWARMGCGCWWRRAWAKLEAYWIVQSVNKMESYDDDDDDFVQKNTVYATGHAWTWNGQKLPGAPSSIKVVTHHRKPYLVKARGCGIRFIGFGMQ